MLKQILTTSLTLASVLLGAGQAMAGTFFVDNFNAPFNDSPGTSQDIFLTGPPPGVPVGGLGPGPQIRSGLPSNSVIGGSRSLDLDKLSGRPREGTRARVLPQSSEDPIGYLSLNSDVSVRARTTLLWDGNGSGLGDAGKLLTRLGTSKGYFGLNFLDTISGSANFSITLSDGTNMSTVTVNNVTATTGPDQFLLSQFAGVNLDSIRYIELVIDGAPGFDANIDSFTLYEIPEPSALVGSIFAVGVSISFLRRKHDDNESGNNN